MRLIFIFVFGCIGIVHTAVYPVFCVAGEAENKFTAAKTAYDNKQYETARSGFANYLQAYPTNAQAVEAKFWLAESLVYLGQYDTAEKYYAEIADISDSVVKNNASLQSMVVAAAFRLCDIPYLQAKYDVAKPRLEAFVDAYPRDKNLQFVLHYLGEIAKQSGAAAETEWYLEQCDRLFPDGVKATEVKFALAWAKNKLGKITEANAIYQQLSASPTSAVVEQANIEWGKALFDRSDYPAAVTALLEFQRKYPASPYYTDSQRYLARCKIAMNDYDSALLVLTQISHPTSGDKLQKVRCLYALNRKSEAQTVLADAENTAGTSYKDEIALVKSVFLYDAQDYQGTTAMLETLLGPRYDANSKTMLFNYTTLSQTSSVKKLSDEALFKAYSLLALCYAKTGNAAKSQSVFAVMQEQASICGGTKLAAICSETASQLGNHRNLTPLSPLSPNNPEIAALNPNPPQNNNENRRSFRTDSPSRFGQWNAGKNTNAGQNTNAVSTAGTDLDRFWRGLQLYERKDYTNAAAQLEQVVAGQYNQAAKQYLLLYQITGADGTLDETSFVKAVTTLALAKAQLGDREQSNAVLTALIPRVKLSDTQQTKLLQETYSQLAETVFSGNNLTAAPAANTSSVIREATALYNTKKYSEADAKLTQIQTPNAEALLLQGKVKYQLGSDAAGLALLERIINEFPDAPQSADALWLLGLYNDSNGDPVKSVVYFQQLMDKFPNSSNIDGALYFLAMDDLTNNSGRKANTYLLRVYRNYLNGVYWSHAVYQLAYECYKKKDYVQANMYIRKVLSHSPDAAILDRVLYLKGELAMRLNDYETAFLAFREVHRLCPDSPLSSFAVRNAQTAANKQVVK